jgi:hypothetical protein
MKSLTQAWLEEEALHGDEELIVVTRCDWAGHGECDGELYELKGSLIRMCKRHLTLHDLWCEVPPTESFMHWLDSLDNETARLMYEGHRENVGMEYWREI